MEDNGTIKISLSDALSTSDDPMRRRQSVDSNSCLVCLETASDKLNNYDRDLIYSLQNIFNDIKRFTNVNELIDFLTGRKQNNTCVILLYHIDECVLSLIHDMPQVHAILILCRDAVQHETLIDKWPKIQGIFKQMALTCDSLKKLVWRNDQSFVTVSIISESHLLDTDVKQLDQTFMYTKLLNEALFNMTYDEQSLKNFTDYCRKQINTYNYFLRDIDKFEQEYGKNHTAIYWYTYPSPIYQILNQALRTQDIDIILAMGFFISDLHYDIKLTHQQQKLDRLWQSNFKVYRGQKLSHIHLQEIMKTNNGLISFNNFLSTTVDHDVAYMFAESNIGDDDFVAVLFDIDVDVTVSSAPFAFLNEKSYFLDQENEVLFSTHTIFRIHWVKKINENENRFWKINLKLTADTDHILNALIEHMRKEIQAVNPQDQLGQLLIKLEKFNEAEKIYRLLLDTTDQELEKANFDYWIGCIKYHKAEYDAARSIHQQVLEIRKKLLPTDDMRIGNSYDMLGVVNSELHFYREALSAHTEALEIRKKHLSDVSSLVATSKLNIALAHRDLREHDEALTYLDQVLEIYSKTLPQFHPDLATAYENIGLIYLDTEKFSKALEVHQKAREIYEKSLPLDHMDLAICYGNIASAYECLEDYTTAREFYSKSLVIKQKFPEHSSLAVAYNNLGYLDGKLGDYSKAIESYEKAIKIYQNNSTLNNLNAAAAYNNAGKAYANMGEYLKACSYLETTIQIASEFLSECDGRFQKWKDDLVLINDKLSKQRIGEDESFSGCLAE